MKKRELTPFMAHELLYDFAIENLDSERQAAMLEALGRFEEIQSDLQMIKTGRQYLETLSQINLSPELIEGVKRRETYWGRIREMMKVDTWPPFARWTAEALSVIFIVAFVAFIAPWGQITEIVSRNTSADFVLAELPRSELPNPLESMDAGLADSRLSFEDDENDRPSEAAQTDRNSSFSKTESKGSVAQAPFDSKRPAEKPNLAANRQEQKDLARGRSPILAALSAAQESTKGKGFVFRGTLSIVNVEAGTTKLKQKIAELGGRKAGQVELGWRRNEGDFYFHFTIPESKLAEIQSYSKTLGNLRLSRDPHPRVMPDGIVRMIITTEESK
jgi:hypothetical protein